MIELAGDDLEVGRIVTVLRWNDVVLDTNINDPPTDEEEFRRWAFRIGAATEPRTAFMGTPLRIVHVHLPYLLVVAPDQQIRIIDFREAHLMGLRQSYWDIVYQALTQAKAQETP